jgi:hypothetical protein
MFAEIRSTVVLNALELTLSTSASSARSKWENPKQAEEDEEFKKAFTPELRKLFDNYESEKRKVN